jgi:hypothetical protein
VFSSEDDVPAVVAVLGAIDALCSPVFNVAVSVVSCSAFVFPEVDIGNPGVVGADLSRLCVCVTPPAGLVVDEVAIAYRWTRYIKPLIMPKVISLRTSIPESSSRFSRTQVLSVRP